MMSVSASTNLTTTYGGLLEGEGYDSMPKGGAGYPELAIGIAGGGQEG